MYTLRILPIVAALTTIFTLSACTSKERGISVAGPEARALLLNRNWIDHLPVSKSDTLHVYRFVPQMGGGVFQERTIFFGTFELFRFEATDGQIRFDLLHTEERRTVGYRIERIAPTPRGGFDLKLTINGSPRGPSVYYGWSKEGQAQSADLDTDLDAVLAVAK